MIPASTPTVVPPVAEITYDHWTPVSIGGSRVGEGVFSFSVRLHKSRVLGNGNTELAPDDAANATLELAVPNIYAPVGEFGDWWTAPVRTAAQTAAGAIIQAAAALGAAKQVL